jgi:putative tricarboxylic transport membrane protein
MERGLRQSLEISRGDFTIFFTRPISAGLLAISAIFVLGATFQMISRVQGDDSEL